MATAAERAQKVLQVVPQPKTIRYKIISFGDENTGKSCLIKRYCEERFIPRYISTIGVDYGVKRVTMNTLTGAVAASGDVAHSKQFQEVRINFWDLAGGDEYAEVRNEFFRDAQGGILVYDVTRRESFAHLDRWLEEATRCGAPAEMPIIVLANKVDLVGQGGTGRAVPEAEGRRWASSKGFSFFECSALSGYNIVSLFNQLFETVYSQRCA